jgi:hypothetical protein
VDHREIGDKFSFKGNNKQHNTVAQLYSEARLALYMPIAALI